MRGVIMNNKRVKHSLYRALLIILVITAMLFSLAFTATEADHECPGTDCAVCAVINMMIKNAGLMLCFSAIISFIRVFFTKKYSFNVFTDSVKLSRVLCV